MPRSRQDAPNIVQDPDVGPTPQQPSTQDQLDKLELNVRARKLRQMQQQEAMVAQANEITAYPKEKQGVLV